MKKQDYPSVITLSKGLKGKPIKMSKHPNEDAYGILGNASNTSHQAMFWLAETLTKHNIPCTVHNSTQRGVCGTRFDQNQATIDISYIACIEVKGDENIKKLLALAEELASK